MKVDVTPYEIVQAAAFEDRGGVERRGFVGLCRHGACVWRPSASFMSTAGVTGPSEVWMMSGGWQAGDRREHAVFGGWVADRTAVSAKATDAAGRTLEDDVVNGVEMFIHRDDFDPSSASVELLDARGAVVRSG